MKRSPHVVRPYGTQVPPVSLADTSPSGFHSGFAWRAELANLGEAEQQLERRKRIEAALDAGHGSCFLQQPDIAALVENALLHFDRERYRLHAWVVMPNHVHVLGRVCKLCSELYLSWDE